MPKDNTKTTIYIATHKMFIPPFCPHYKIMKVQEQKQENIAFKSKYYSELIALYKIWKKSQDKIIGFTHYHRYFYKNNFITVKEINQILKEKDIILPLPIKFSETMYEQYASVHYEKDLKLACHEIEKQHREEYHYSIRSALESTEFYPYNMFIAPREIVNDYCSFLFPILSALEEKIPFQSYSSYNQRVFGFLAERIFNIYLKKQNFLIQEYPVIDTLSEKQQELKRQRTLNALKEDKNRKR